MNRLLVVAVIAFVGSGCGTNTDSYRQHWCATYCVDGHRSAQCDTECGALEPSEDAGSEDAGVFDAGTPDAGELIDAGTSIDAGEGLDAGEIDAGGPDGGLDAGEPDAGQLDSGVVDAGRVLTHDGGYVTFIGGSTTIQRSAAACSVIQLGLFQVDDAPNTLPTTVTIEVTGGAEAELYASDCIGAKMTTLMLNPIDGVAEFHVRSPSFEPTILKISSSEFRPTTLHVDFTARIAMHVSSQSQSCQLADIGLYSSDGLWKHVRAPTGIVLFALETDAGIVSTNTTCTAPQPAVGIRPDGGVTAFSIKVLGSGAVNASVASLLVAPVVVNVGLPTNASATAEANMQCDAGCTSGGCVQAPTPVCQCLASGATCTSGALYQCCGATTVMCPYIATPRCQ